MYTNHSFKNIILKFPGVHSPRALDLSPPGGGASRGQAGQANNSGVGGVHPNLPPLPLPPPHMTCSPPPVTPNVTPTISHAQTETENSGTISPPAFQPPVSAAAAFIAAAAAAAAASTSPTSDHENHNNQVDRPRIGRSRRGRGGRGLRSERMAAAIGSGSPRSLSEMSVRGLDLLRYATLAPDGTYRFGYFEL